jgi:hypothetical protein
MHVVIRPAARAAALFLIAPFLTFASALAPQHVHEPGPGHDHDLAVAHSHFGPHKIDVHDDDVTEIEHDIEHVVWLDSPILHEAPYRTAPVASAIPVTYEIVPAELHWAVTQIDTAAPAHGPPRSAHRLRSPPRPRLS